jgi:hypothetical protein
VPTLTFTAPLTRLDALFSEVDWAERRALLGQFADAVADLRQDRVDKVVVTARRATAIALEVLAAYRLEPIDDDWFGGRIVSDRYLPLIPSGSWRRRRVRVLDDAKVTGQALDSVRAQVARLQWIAQEDVQYDIRIVERRKVLEHYPRMEKLGRQLAVCLGKAVRPLLVDFGVSQETVIGAATLWRLLYESDLTTVDVTARRLWESGVRDYSVIVSGRAWDAFRDRVGVVADLVEVAKIRVFTYDSFGQIRMRVAPTALTRGIEVERLRDWLGEMGIAGGTVEDDADVQAAGALVSFMLSNALLGAFAEHIGGLEGLEDVENRLGLDMDHARVVLGQDLVAKALDPANLATLATLVPTRPGGGPPAEDLRHPALRLSATGDVESRFIALGDGDTTAAFGEIARRKIKEEKPGAMPPDTPEELAEAVEAKPLSAPLLRPGGDTTTVFAEIARRKIKEENPGVLPPIRLEELAEATQANALGASLVLDTANDAGLCVPVWMVQDGSLVVRGYRGSEATPGRWNKLKRGRYGGRLLTEAATHQSSLEPATAQTTLDKALGRALRSEPKIED